MRSRPTFCCGLAVFVTAFSPFSALSREAVMRAPDASCMREDVSFSVNFNGARENIEDVEGILNEKTAKLNALAKKAGLDELKVTNKSYNIYENNNSNGDERYQYSGSLSFTIKPPGKGIEFFKLLSANRYQANLNVTQYPQSSCDGEAAEE